ncbi:MAG: hypothetical protein QF639_03500 [Rhodospirillales bacterium]|jgi:hypothetical protein|nr:hypothetical protein [Rhodospirillales bacterium]
MKSFELPPPRDELEMVMNDGVPIGARIHGNARGTRLFFSHGNGFAADAEMDGASASAVANRALTSESDYLYEGIAGTGHLLLIEKSEACIGAMTSFLDEQGISV